MNRFLLALALSSCAAAASATPAVPLTRWFSDGWSRADVDAAPPPAAPAASSPAPQDGPIHAEHSPVAHMYLTLKAFEMYAARYDSGELARYMGTTSGDKPASDGDDTLVGGSYYEDSPGRNPWGESVPELRHFWDCRRGPTAGLWGYDSSVNRAQKYMTGGYGLDGALDDGWTKHGVAGEGAEGLYRKGDKAKAFWYLGHAVHLLEDLTVPAHALLFPHPFSGDAYESYMKTHHGEWGDVPAGDVESFGSLYDLFEKTGNVTNDFDAGRSASSGADGKADRGARRARGFPEVDLKQEGDVLMPLAMKRAAALFRLFYADVDHAGPSVRLDVRVDGTHASLRAGAFDGQSGVDRRGWRLEVAEWTGARWSPWVRVGGDASLAELELAPGRRYAARAWAVDAAGNRGLSPARTFSGEPVVAAD